MPSDVLKTAAITRSHSFELVPDASARAALAETLGIEAIRKLRFTGTIAPEADADLTLTATLGATVVQDCVVTGEPVTTRIDEPLQRRYLAEMELPAGDEIEMPDDDTAEPLPDELDLSEVMAEALALLLPPWPRAEGVEPVNLTVTEPGKTPMSDDDAKPFAGLKALKDAMEKKQN
ncbi:MAG: DUF177 domain-containing protein [Pseudomonadota bacterium]